MRIALAILLLVPLSARAQSLLAEFTFAGTLASTEGNATLTSLGGTLGSTAYTFGPDQGLLLSGLAFNPASYTIELNFTLANISGWRKIIDFNLLGPDSGFYNSPSQQLAFYPVTQSGATDFTADEPVHVVLTRDGATNLVTGYVNGVARIAFTDSSGIAVFSGQQQEIYLFTDDHATGQGEASAGAVDLFRVYDGPLSSEQVQALFTAVPEPASDGLLALGLALLLVKRRRRDLPAGSVGQDGVGRNLV